MGCARPAFGHSSLNLITFFTDSEEMEYAVDIILFIVNETKLAFSLLHLIFQFSKKEFIKLIICSFYRVDFSSLCWFDTKKHINPYSFTIYFYVFTVNEYIVAQEISNL